MRAAHNGGSIGGGSGGGSGNSGAGVTVGDAEFKPAASFDLMRSEMDTLRRKASVNNSAFGIGSRENDLRTAVNDGGDSGGDSGGNGGGGDTRRARGSDGEGSNSGSGSPGAVARRRSNKQGHSS
jgi:hypothetical protein